MDEYQICKTDVSSWLYSIRTIITAVRLVLRALFGISEHVCTCMSEWLRRHLVWLACERVCVCVCGECVQVSLCNCA